MKKKIYCFDFDGTLTTSDTLLEFIRYAKGTGRFLMFFLMYNKKKESHQRKAKKNVLNVRFETFSTYDRNNL